MPAAVGSTAIVGAMPTPWCGLPSCLSTFMPVHQTSIPPGSVNGLTFPFVPAVVEPTISASLYASTMPMIDSAYDIAEASVRNATGIDQWGASGGRFQRPAVSHFQFSRSGHVTIGTFHRALSNVSCARWRSTVVEASLG